MPLQQVSRSSICSRCTSSSMYTAHHVHGRLLWRAAERCSRSERCAVMPRPGMRTCTFFATSGPRLCEACMRKRREREHRARWQEHASCRARSSVRACLLCTRFVRRALLQAVRKLVFRLVPPVLPAASRSTCPACASWRPRKLHRARLTAHCHSAPRPTPRCAFAPAPLPQPVQRRPRHGRTRRCTHVRGACRCLCLPAGACLPRASSSNAGRKVMT